MIGKLTILWVDDQRDPYSYLNKKSKSATFVRNKEFYDKLLSQYEANFVWVKNLYQFIDYIETNGVPQFVSFDHDLNNRGGGEGLSDEQKLSNNGVQCAKWLVNYCKKNKQPLPKFYVHSANPKHGPEINKVMDAGLGENKNNKNVIKITEKELHNIIIESVNNIIYEEIEINEFKKLCERIYPFKRYIREIKKACGVGIKNDDRNLFYGFYEEIIDNFISNYGVREFYDDLGYIDREKLNEYLNDTFEYDIYSE